MLGKAVEAFGTFKMSLEVSEACQNLPLDSFKKSGKIYDTFGNF